MGGWGVKCLNLYAGIGGNRKLWMDVEVTAVEIVPEIAKIYQDFFPNDKVIVADAHQYLLDHFKEFEFIWSSPPCPSHSRARYWGSFGENKTKIYPDMNLYQEIIFLQHYCKNNGGSLGSTVEQRRNNAEVVQFHQLTPILYVVENVRPYYEPLIKAQKLGRHLFWANFYITPKDFKTKFTPNQGFSSLCQTYGVDLSKYDLPYGQNNRIFIRNMVEPELGLHILNESKRNACRELFK